MDARITMRILILLVLLSGCTTMKEESELRYIRGYIVDIRKAEVTVTVHPIDKKNDTIRNESMLARLHAEGGTARGSNGRR